MVAGVGVGGVAERCVRIERDDGFDSETSAAPTGLGERAGDAFDTVTAMPATGSLHHAPNATPTSPVRAPADEMASSQEWRASAISVADWICVPARSL